VPERNASDIDAVSDRLAVVVLDTVGVSDSMCVGEFVSDKLSGSFVRVTDLDGVALIERLAVLDIVSSTDSDGTLLAVGDRTRESVSVMEAKPVTEKLL
jgi:hypothetical protein